MLSPGCSKREELLLKLSENSHDDTWGQTYMNGIVPGPKAGNQYKASTTKKQDKAGTAAGKKSRKKQKKEFTEEQIEDMALEGVAQTEASSPEKFQFENMNVNMMRAVCTQAWQCPFPQTLTGKEQAKKIFLKCWKTQLEKEQAKTKKKSKKHKK